MPSGSDVVVNYETSLARLGLHTRTISVIDQKPGRAGAAAAARVHLHPDAGSDRARINSATLHAGSRRAQINSAKPHAGDIMKGQQMRRLVMVAVALPVIAVISAAAWLYTPDRPRFALEAKYAGPPSTFVKIAGLRVHLRDTGPRNAPAIILLHGFGASLHTWDAWAQNLEADYRVIRFDLPGFGLTGPDPTGDYTDARTIEVLLALLDHLGVAQTTLIGNSMGGRIAWTFAAEHPERVNKLVLMAPDGFASPGLSYGVAPEVPWMMRMLPYTLPTPLLRATLAPAYADTSVMTDNVVARYRDMMLAPGVRRAIVARLPQTVLTRPEPLLQRIKAPTLLLWGEKDKMVPVTNAPDYLREISSARLVTFADLGHLPQEEAPSRSLEALRAFLVQ